MNARLDTSYFSSVSSAALASCRGHTVRERANVVFIHLMCFVVAALAFFDLLLEAAALIFRIIQFTKTVGDFHFTGENFPALGPIRLVRFLLGERRNSRREFVNDGWLG